MAKGRWGHKAVYVPSCQSVYIVGGQVSGRSGSGSGSSGLEITNEVLMLNVSLSSCPFPTNVYRSPSSRLH